MGDVAVYLLPLAVFAVIVVVVKVRPSAPRRQRLVTGDPRADVGRQLGLRGRKAVERILARGRKIEAVALVRQRTEASLGEATDLVERIQRTRVAERGRPSREG